MFYIDILQNDIRIRNVLPSDFPIMLEWLTDKRVLEFYAGRDINYDMKSLTEHYTKIWPTIYYRTIIEYKKSAVGYCQIYKLYGNLFDTYNYPNPDNKIVFATDQFIGEPEYWNTGIGSKFLKMILDFLKQKHNADAIILDPHKDNLRAINAYKKAGFRIIADLPRHELFEGKKVDCYLIEYKYQDGNE